MSPLEQLRLSWKVPALERASSLSLLLSEGLPLVNVGLVLERTITTENDLALKIPQQNTSQAAWPGPFFPWFRLEKLVEISFAQHAISSLEWGQSSGSAVVINTRDGVGTPPAWRWPRSSSFIVSFHPLLTFETSAVALTYACLYAPLSFLVENVCDGQFWSSVTTVKSHLGREVHEGMV